MVNNLKSKKKKKNQSSLSNDETLGRRDRERAVRF